MKEDQKQVTEGGNATFSVKVPPETYELVNILCEGLEHGTNGNDLVKMFIHAFIESAKHDGPISPELQMFLNMLRLNPEWHKAFNFADVTAQAEVAQVILVLQQRNEQGNTRKGFGLTMIDKPFMGEPTVTYCVDDILERIIKVSMPGLYRRLDNIGQRLCCTSVRETLVLLSEHMSASLDKEEDQQELPVYDNRHDFGRAIEYGNKYKRKKHIDPDLLARQQTIHFNDDDRDVADLEVKDWEGEHKGNSDDGLIDGIRPFDVEY